MLLVWRYFAKRPVTKKRLAVAAIAILILFSNNFLYSTLVMAWQPAPVEISGDKKYDAAIVLGGLSGYDKYNRGFFGNNADRFIQTANLYHRGIVKKIIISGGSGSFLKDEPGEAIFLREQFIANGISDSAISWEARSKNTYENAVYSKQLVDSMHLQQPVLLVTSALHMRRSMHVFARAGFHCVPVPCDYKVTSQRLTVIDFLPDVDVLAAWPLFLKEVVGLVVYRLTGKA